MKLNIKNSKRTMGAYKKMRIMQLLEDNAKEDDNIKRLEKKLKVGKYSRRRDKSNCKLANWTREYGLDYILNFEEESKNTNPSSDLPNGSIGVTSDRKRGSVDIYGQDATVDKIPETINELSPSVMIYEGCKMNLNDVDPTLNANIGNVSNTRSTDHVPMLIKRTVKQCLNQLSETQMTRVVAELVSLFMSYPRAISRSVLMNEVIILLQSTPIMNVSSSFTGWLQQDLAVCLACVHITLHLQLEQDNLVGYLTESLLVGQQCLFSVSSAGVVASFALFLAYLFRFGVLSANLILSILQELLKSTLLSNLKAAHAVCIAVGVNLRKSDLTTCQEIVRQVRTRLKDESMLSEVDIICELEGIIQRLSEKFSKSECVQRAMHLKKQMKAWIKAESIPDDICLRVTLNDLRNPDTIRGRWWIVGSVAPTTGHDETGNGIGACIQPLPVKTISQLNLHPEIDTAASRLGLRTPARKHLFNLLVNTPGGPDATASALLRACSTGRSIHQAHREQELVQIVLHCSMAEEPFNRFYPRVLGCLLNFHRRFQMTVKCAIWDVMKNPDFTYHAKVNAGRTIGLLTMVYELPLTVIKAFDFSDNSEPNIALLYHLLMELSTGNYKVALEKLLQLSAYTRLSRNCRIFMRKHFQLQSSDGDEQNRKAFVLRLADEMRNMEKF